MKTRILILVLMLSLLAGCVSPAAQPAQTRANPPGSPAAAEAPATDVPAADSPLAPTEGAAAPEAGNEVPSTLPAPTPTEMTVLEQASADTSAPAALPPASGPDEFPAGVSPLTGLPVDDASALSLAPAMVSITNFPISARPQAGLSYSPFVFEMYIGEGMTRFLGLFYGDFPTATGDAQPGVSASNDGIGPIRSGRLPYESLRQLYNGFLVMASASSSVLPSLGSAVNVFGSDESDINSALIPVTKLKAIAEKSVGRMTGQSLTGLRFDSQPPEGGQDARMMWIPFSYLNQVIWRYDPASGAFLRYQDNADGTNFTQATDRLNGEALQYENVVILFANHHARAETLINVDLMYQNRTPALLFRDGKMYEVYWTTANTEYERKTGQVRPIRFVDAQGNPFPLKPGQTWVEIVQPFTRYNETVDPGTYIDMKRQVKPGSGNWAIHFYPPAVEEE